MINLDDYNKPIKSIINFITIIIAFYIIFDEIFKLTLFVYKYNYNYNYGDLLNNLCGNENTEHDTNRFQLYSNINEIKLNNDIYNKTNYILIALIISIIFTIIIILSFSLLFHYSFIIDGKCKVLKELDNNSEIKQFFNCFCGDFCTNTINTCSFTYLILFIITIILPLTIILNIFLNFNISIDNTYYIPIFIGFIIILILFRIPITNNIRILNDDNKYNIYSIIIYFVFLFIFICSLYFYKNIFDIYKNYNLNNINLYIDNTNTNIYNNNGDANFYNIYKREKPITPNNPLTSYTYNEQSILKSFKIDKNKEQENDTIYNSNLVLYTDYTIKKDNYNKLLKEYNQKLNLYNNNNYINDPVVINIFDNIFLNIIGYNNPNNISKYIIILGFISILLYLIYIIFNKKLKSETDFMYNTLFIPIFNIFLIFLLINSITVFNTYINKYIIYNPSSLYKNDIQKVNYKYGIIIDDLKSMLLNTPCEIYIGNTILYNIFSAMFSLNLENNVVNSNPAITTYITTTHINDFYNTSPPPATNNNTYLTSIINTTFVTHASPITALPTTEQLKTAMSLADTTPKTDVNILLLIDGIVSTKEGFLTFIKNIFIVDLNNISKITKNLNNNIIYDFCDNKGNSKNPNILTSLKTTNRTSTDLLLFKKDITNVKTPIEKNILNVYLNDYPNYNSLINQCVNEYKQYILDIRKLLIQFLLKENILQNCDTTYDVINISNIDTYISTKDIYTLITSSTYTGIKNKINKTYYMFLININKILNSSSADDSSITTKISIIKRIIDNYNKIHNNDYYYSNKDFLEYSFNYRDYNDNAIETEKYSNDMKINMTTSSNSIYILVFLIIFILLEPLYI